MPAWAARRGPLVVGDVAGLEFEREVAGESGVGECLESVAKVDRAAADREVDVARHRVADVDVLDARAEPVDELDRVSA